MGLSRRGPVDGEFRQQFTGDVCDAEFMRRSVADAKPDCVVHLAGTLPADPATEHYGVNAIGTINLLESVLDVGGNATVILGSSSAVYGSGTPVDRAARETDRLEPLSPYGASKASEEFIGGYYCRSRGARVIVARSFNLVGPGLPGGLLASDVARQVVRAEAGNGGKVITVGPLDTARDFLDVRDAAAAYLLLLERGRVGETYNVCSGRMTPVSNCVEQLVSRARVAVSLEQVDRPVARREVRRQVGDPTRVIEATGWRPRIPLDQSLGDLLDECRDSYQAGLWQ